VKACPSVVQRGYATACSQPTGELISRILRIAGGVVLILGAAAFLRPLPAQQPTPAFGPGERLRYEVEWRLIPAGHAELWLDADATPGFWKATVRANSTGYVSNLYKVEDEYASTFSGRSFCSLGIRKTIHEGDRHREVDVQFDPFRRLGLLRERDTAGAAPPRQEQFPIPECVHDILSAFHYVRSLPLAIGESFEFPLNDGVRTLSIRIEVQALEEVPTDLGTFEAYRVEPDVFAGQLFQQKGRLFVWLSNDEQRIPVQLRAQIGIGTIVASLAGIEREGSSQ